MRVQALRACFAVTWLILLSVVSTAQSITRATAIKPDSAAGKWKVEVSFLPAPAAGKIKHVLLLNLDEAKIVPLQNEHASTFYSAIAVEPLELVTPQTSCLQFLKHYEIRAAVENAAGDKIITSGAELIPQETVDHCQRGKVERAKAKEADDADVYISGQVNGAHDKDVSFTAAIKLQRYRPISPSWRLTPFFKLNASTDADADPDSMEVGLKVRHVLDKFAGAPGAYFDNDIKIESQRDFENTNLIYAARLTLLPAAFPRNPASKGKGFFNPYIGAEAGKNLKSPLKGAEGDGIARLLAGADLRFAFFVKDGGDPDINWTTSFTRRWLLVDELGFRTDKDGLLQLVRFGTSPRDYLLSKVSYKLTKFLDIFGAYEWGQLPPSYKFVDHRFQFGFAYKYKFAVK